MMSLEKKNVLLFEAVEMSLEKNKTNYFINKNNYFISFIGHSVFQVPLPPVIIFIRDFFNIELK